MRRLCGPTASPYVQLYEWIARPTEFLDRCTRKYGDVFQINFRPGREPFTLIGNPELNQALLGALASSFDTGRVNGSLLPLLGENSLMLLDGQAHQRQRKLLMPAFHGERMQAYGQLIVALTRQVLDERAGGSAFGVRAAMQQVSLGVILQAVFGLTEGPRDRQLRVLVAQMVESLGSPLQSSFIFLPQLQRDWGAWSPWSRFLRSRRQLDALLYAAIAERRRQFDPECPDILTLLLAARDEQGEAMSDRELRDELLTMLVAGHETTASAMAWGLYWVSTVEGVREKLLAELAGLGLDPDLVALARLPYLNAVCSETLRLYPVVIITFPRLVKQPFDLGDYHFEPGNILAGNIYSTHHRSDLYPNPDCFRPERFLQRQFGPTEFMPFGGGSRRCIGLALALFELKLALATALQYDFQLATTGPVRPVRRGITLAPSRQLRATVRRRTAPLPVTV